MPKPQNATTQQQQINQLQLRQLQRNERAYQRKARINMASGIILVLLVTGIAIIFVLSQVTH